MFIRRPLQGPVDKIQGQINRVKYAGHDRDKERADDSADRG
jgi:hypothetical protein